MVADDRVSGTDADRHDAISRNGSSWFGGNTDSAETADLARILINAPHIKCSEAPRRFRPPLAGRVSRPTT